MRGLKKFAVEFFLIAYVILQMGCTGIGFAQHIFIPRWIGYLIFGFYILPLLRALSVVPKVRKCQ